MKRVYKLTPYPWYKPEETERWLEEKARNGLFLSKGTVIRFFAAFERQEPKAVRYRLAAPAGHSDGSGTPSGEEVGIAQEMGWTYTARDGEFAVYRCDDTEAPELNTDPEVEAMSLKRIRRRGMSGLFSSIFWLVLLAGLITVGRVWLLLLMDESGWMVLSASLMGLIDLVVSAGKTFRLWKLYRRLKNGRPAKERSLRTPRRTPRVTAAQLGNILALITAVGMMVNCIGYFFTSKDSGGIPISEYTAPFPFPTMAEMGKEGSFVQEDFQSYNEVQEQEFPLIGKTIRLSENGRFEAKDGRKIQGFWFIDYAQCKNAWLAREFAAECSAEAQRQARKSQSGSIDLPSAELLGLDSISGYPTELLDSTTLILLRGDRAVQIRFYQLSEDTLSVDEWAKMFANALNEE